MSVVKCKVLSTNECCSVITYEGVGEIQIPIPNIIGDVAYVKIENGLHVICTKKEYDDFIKMEKTTDSEVAETLNLELGIVDKRVSEKRPKRANK